MHRSHFQCQRQSEIGRPSERHGYRRRLEADTADLQQVAAWADPAESVAAVRTGEPFVNDEVGSGCRDRVRAGLDVPAQGDRSVPQGTTLVGSEDGA